MNYAVQLRIADDLIRRGNTTEAMQSLGKALEHLYKDLYRQLLGHLPPSQRAQVTEVENKIGRGRPIDRLMLGQLAGLFRDADIVSKLEEYLNLKLEFMNSFNSAYLVSLRNRATHQDIKISEDEAWLCYWQLYQLLKETGRPVPELASAQVQKEPLPARSDPGPQVSNDDWTRFAQELSESLELESKTFRVPVDILQNRVVELRDDQPGRSKPEESKPWLEVALDSEERLTVLLGDPGEGKTVCFATLAGRLLDGFRSDHDAPLPLKVRLAFYEQRHKPLAHLLAEELRAHHLEVPDISDVHWVLSQRRLYVLLDGLNEVPDPIPLIGELKDLIGLAPQNRYFVSCRNKEYERVREPLPAHKPWRLVGFDDEEIEEFLERYLHEDPGRKTRLESWLSDRRLAEVLGTPFFLSLFANLDPVDLPSPKNRAELCQLFIDGLQVREQKVRAELRASGEPWPMLEVGAFQMQQQHETHLPRVQFEELCRGVWGEQLYGQETATPHDATLQALYNSPLLTRELGKVAFTHDLFRDFFAARAFRSRDDLNDSASFARFVGDSWWDYTIVLLSGLLPDASKVLYNIVYEGSNYDLAVRCLRESKRLNLQVVQDIIEWLRQSHQFWQLFNLGPLLSSLPEEAKQWRVDEAKAIVRTGLASDDELWGQTISVLWRVWHSSGWPISEDMISCAIKDAMDSTNDTMRGNALPFLAQQGRWDILAGFANDPSPHVREKLAGAVDWTDLDNQDRNELVGAIEKLGRDPEPGVRCAAMKAAGMLGKNGGVEILVKGFEDPDTNVQLTAFLEIMNAEGASIVDARSKAVVHLYDLLYDIVVDRTYPDRWEEDPWEEVADALEQIDTPESSEILFTAVLTGQARESWVAAVLVGRGDPRALQALLVGMLSWPKGYFDDLWRRDYVQERLASLFDHPFELAWLEALLVKHEVFEELGFDAPGRCWRQGQEYERLDPRAALEAMVEAAKSSRPALFRLLWSLLTAYEWLAAYPVIEDSLLMAAIFRLVEIDPTVLVDMVMGSWTDVFDTWTPDTASELAARLMGAAITFMDALPDEKREALLEYYRKNLRTEYD